MASDSRNLGLRILNVCIHPVLKRRLALYGDTVHTGEDGECQSFIFGAARIYELGLFPGWKLHALKGNLTGFWSLTVTGNWRLVFRFDPDTAYVSEVDLIDYH